MIDRFANEYGWTEKITFKHTLYQLDQLGNQIQLRKADNIRLLTMSIRNHNAPVHELSEWLESLKPTDVKESEMQTSALPVGIAVG